MFRKREGKRWKVSAEVFFRFNPEKFADEANEVRTFKALKKEQNRTLNPDNPFNGARERTRTSKSGSSHAPEACASTNFATRARLWNYRLELKFLSILSGYRAVI